MPRALLITSPFASAMTAAATVDSSSPLAPAPADTRALAAAVAHVDLVAAASLGLRFVPLAVDVHRFAAVGGLVAPIVAFVAALIFIHQFSACFVHILSGGFFCSSSSNDEPRRRSCCCWKDRRRVQPTNANIEAPTATPPIA